MRICKHFTAAILVALSVALPLASRAQDSSLGTFSPYSLYGLGDLNSTGGNSSFAGVGGASIGFRNVFVADGGFDNNVDTKLNTSNPASLSGLAPKAFIFDVGFAGSNSYLGQKDAAGGMMRTSFNTFNIKNITLAFPLAPKLGFALNVSPFSQVGYRIHTDDLSYLADLGIVRYFYNGQGDVTEAKAQLGWAINKRLSIGAEAMYLWGNIDRTYQAMILDYTGQGSYEEISSRGGSTANTNEKVSRLFGSFGVQYTPVLREKTRLTLGATYRPGGELRSTVTDFIPSNNIYGDTIRFDQRRSATYLPNRIGVGAYFHRPKWAVGADYVFEDWGARNGSEAGGGARYVNTHTIKAGVEYTPNRYDIRGKGASFFNRITYKAGFRHNNNYIDFGARNLNESAITLGVDIPFSAMTVSKVSVGLELGQRGNVKSTGLVRERFFRVNVGVLLFGRDYDYWFEKYKYN